MSIRGDEPAPTTRRSLLLIDADPLLRWSIVTHLRTAFDVEVAQTLEEGRALLARRAFDAVVLSNAYAAQAIRDLESLAKLENEEVTIVRLTTGVQEWPRERGIESLEKPFELASLSKALRAGTT